MLTHYHRREEHLKAIMLLVSVLCAVLASAETQRPGVLVLTRIWDGRTMYKRCELRISYPGGWVESGGAGGQAYLICTPNASPTSDLLSERRLSEPEIDLVRTLAESSDFYNGGHIGTSGGPRIFETLTVGCCGRREMVVLVTYGNPTFENAGPRRRLVTLLREWQDDLLRAEEQSRRNRSK